MRATDGSGLRKRQQSGFAAVPNETVWDDELPARALGILTKLIALPEDWKLRTDWLVEKCQPGGDGREAVMTALRNLRRLGYYRVERRRRADGTFTSGVSISDVRVPEWVEQHRAACLDQGTDKPKWDIVLRLLDDGRVEDEPLPGFPELTGGHTGLPPGNRRSDPETGFPVLVDPALVEPYSGEPYSGLPDVKTQTEIQTHTQGGAVEEGSHQRGPDVDEPSPSTPDGINRTCQAHRLTPAPGPCPPCGDWRRAVDVAVEQARVAAAVRAQDARDAARRARALTDREADACGLCDDEGTATVTTDAGTETTVCLHDAARNRNAVAIRQDARAAAARIGRRSQRVI